MLGKKGYVVVVVVVVFGVSCIHLVLTNYPFDASLELGTGTLMATSSYLSTSSLLPAKVTIFPFFLESKLHVFVLVLDNWI